MYHYKPDDGREKLKADRQDSRVVRGGAFNYYVNFARVAYRYRHDPDGRYDDVGFRVVVSPFSSDLEPVFLLRTDRQSAQ